MGATPFTTDANYLSYIQGLHRLHALAMTGEDEGDEAEVIRDHMDGPWMHLTETERERIGGLSADLYSLSDPQEPVLPMTASAQRKLVEAIEAREAGEWDKALGILRECRSSIEPALLAQLRGTIWEAAGDGATAALFFAHAARLAPAAAVEREPSEHQHAV